MRPRHPLPRLWLMTDERQGDRLWDALARLPEGGGVVFRHYSLPQADRHALFEDVRRVTRERGHVLLSTGSPFAGADGVHNGRGPGLRTASAHGLREIHRAERSGADLIFLSPVFATRSHPQARPLGTLRFASLARRSRVPLVALGGMNETRFRTLRGAYGWAGIDAWSA
jgi:thiamine-phosphate pyrophosphorylase